MKPYRYSLLSIAIVAACCSQYVIADLRMQCLQGIPTFQGDIIQGDQTLLPVYIESDRMEMNYPSEATYFGEVSVKQGNRSLITEKAKVEQNNEQMRFAYLIGKFDYRDNFINAIGNNAKINLNNYDAQLGRVDYHLVDRQGRGIADEVMITEQARRMKNATFTACLPHDNSWAIEANEMVQHVEEEYAEVWHARFKVLGIPIFYSPYLQFPIGDRRRSGLLAPSVGHSRRDGYIYAQPIYWNIASNMDMTFVPTYYSKRGWQIAPELRYLTYLGEGKIAGEYLGKDRLENWANHSKSRYMLFWQHDMSFFNNWRLAVDYKRVSDSRYFSDFNSMYGNSTDGYAVQQFKLGYYHSDYNFSISGKKFQSFYVENDSTTYHVLPKIELNYYKNNLVSDVDFKMFGQMAHFVNQNKLMPSAWRFHLEPSLNVPFVNRLGSLALETKLYTTYYLQKLGQSQVIPIESHILRVLPQFKLDFKTVLEKERPLFNGFSQVFEPTIQYLYRPYKNQGNIGVRNPKYLGLGYDSVLLQQDYYSLFNERSYSGLDRIASANQVTLGGTTRFFSDKTGKEVFNFSAGQIQYLSPSRVDSESLNSDTKHSSSWSLESNWKFHSNWNWHGSYQYDTRLNETSLANVSLQFKPKNNNVIQLNYRYASKNYIDQNLSDNRYGQDIKQVGGIIAWSLSNNVSIVMSHYQDIALKKLVESQLGLNYSTCCWSANFYTSRHLISTPMGKSDTINDFYYDNRFGINFEVRFNGNYEHTVPKMLKKGILPYIEAFNIN